MHLVRPKYFRTVYTGHYKMFQYNLALLFMTLRLNIHVNFMNTSAILYQNILEGPVLLLLNYLPLTRSNVWGWGAVHINNSRLMWMQYISLDVNISEQYIQVIIKCFGTISHYYSWHWDSIYMSLSISWGGINISRFVNKKCRRECKFFHNIDQGILLHILN